MATRNKKRTTEEVKKDEEVKKEEDDVKKEEDDVKKNEDELLSFDFRLALCHKVVKKMAMIGIAGQLQGSIDELEAIKLSAPLMLIDLIGDLHEEIKNLKANQ